MPGLAEVKLRSSLGQTWLIVECERDEYPILKLRAYSRVGEDYLRIKYEKFEGFNNISSIRSIHVLYNGPALLYS